VSQNKDTEIDFGNAQEEEKILIELEPVEPTSEED
jgi:hypothetical protein